MFFKKKKEFTPVTLKDFINYCEIIILNKENIKYGHDE